MINQNNVKESNNKKQILKDQSVKNSMDKKWVLW